VQEGEKWVLTAPLQDIYPGIPETLQQMLENQFEQLSAEEQRILETCSVAGERFSVWAAAAMLETLPTSIEETCDRLAQRQQFIRFVVFKTLRMVRIQPITNSGTRYTAGSLSPAFEREPVQTSPESGRVAYGCLHCRKTELASELALHFEVGGISSKPRVV